MSYVSPYMHDVVEHQTSRKKRIIEVTLNFINRNKLGNVLDVGTRNPLTEIFEKHYLTKIANTNIDLDVDELTGQYDTVLCFEVIEHLFNPLHLLIEIHKILKNDGRLYLSTPKGRPYFLWFKHHFHEFHERELRSIIKRAGFELVQIKYFRILPWWEAFKGFRPFLRIFLQRKCLVELKKIA